jgi:predicted glutamine amidotransferase
MCRLFGYVSDRPTAVVDELGADAFREFTALTRVHGDGWGMAWHDEDGGTRTARSPASADEDPEYGRLAARPLGAAGFVHLRWATGGLDVNPHNTHPFVDGDYAFAHNGHVAPIEARRDAYARAAREARRHDRQRAVLPLRDAVHRTEW